MVINKAKMRRQAIHITKRLKPQSKMFRIKKGETNQSAIMVPIKNSPMYWMHDALRHDCHAHWGRRSSVLTGIGGFLSPMYLPYTIVLCLTTISWFEVCCYKATLTSLLPTVNHPACHWQSSPLQPRAKR